PTALIIGAIINSFVQVSILAPIENSHPVTQSRHCLGQHNHAGANTTHGPDAKTSAIELPVKKEKNICHYRTSDSFFAHAISVPESTYISKQPLANTSLSFLYI